MLLTCSFAEKLRFLCSRRRFLSKNRDLLAANDDFCRKIAIYWLPTAISVEKSRFIGCRRRFLSKNRDLLAADGCFHQKPAGSEFPTAVSLQKLCKRVQRKLVFYLPSAANFLQRYDLASANANKTCFNLLCRA